MLNQVRSSVKAGKRNRCFGVSLATILLLVGGVNLGAEAPLAAQQPTASLQKFEKTEVHMGAPFKIVFYSDDEKVANRAFERAFERIAQLNKVLSDYDLESETSRLCAGAPHLASQTVSADLFEVLAISDEISRQTNGAFDVTVGPLTKLWRRARRQKELPEKAQLSEALRAVGRDGLDLDRAKKSVRLTKTAMRLDFGGIGQGYAADEVLKILSGMGITRALVNASGDVVALEAPPSEKGWKVAIAGLQPKTEPPKSFVWLRNGSITSSGDAFQSVEIDGKRYSHIVDPKTGLGVDRRIAATCYAPSGTIADALATALCVLPAKQGMEIISREFPGVEILVVEGVGDEVTETASPGFPMRMPIEAGIFPE